MSRWAWVAGMALALLACTDSPTSPPSGLPVTLAFLTTPTTAAIVAGAGDSAVVTVSADSLDVLRCGYSLSLAAGIEDGTLIVTVTVTDPSRGVGYLCPRVPDPPLLTAQAVVHEIPPGHFQVVLVRRADHRSVFPTEQTVAHGSISIP
jgi:hypothetical protein